ncbi:uncharacterized protein LOC141856667 isoform X1 [Brevipalpus obovatus]
MSDHEDFEILAFNDSELEALDLSSDSNKKRQQREEKEGETLKDSFEAYPDSDVEEIDEDEPAMMNSIDTDSMISQLSGCCLRRRSVDQLSLHTTYPNNSQENLQSNVFEDGNEESIQNNPYTNSSDPAINKFSNGLVLSILVGIVVMCFIDLTPLFLNRNGEDNRLKLTINDVNKLREVYQPLSNCLTNVSEDEKNSTPKIDVCLLGFSSLYQEARKYYDSRPHVKESIRAVQSYWQTSGELELLPQFFNCEEAVKIFKTMDFLVLTRLLQTIGVVSDVKKNNHGSDYSPQKLSRLMKENNHLRTELFEERVEQKPLSSSLEERILQLESENAKLKMRLDWERSEGTISSARRLEMKINDLRQENSELREALKQLQNQVGLAGDYSNQVKPSENIKSSSDPLELLNGEKDDSLKIDLLRQRINSMVQENDDLKSTIARLRWSGSPQEVKSTNEVDEWKLSELEKEITKLTDLLVNERDEATKWKKMYEEMLQKLETTTNPKDDSLKDDVLAWLDSPFFSEKLWESWNLMPQEPSDSEEFLPVKEKVNQTLSMLIKFQEKLWEKWNGIKKFPLSDHVSFSKGQKTMVEMIELLVSSLRKLQDMSSKYVGNNKPVSQKIDKFAAKMAKTLETLESKWILMEKKLLKAFQGHNFALQPESSGLSNWYLKRAQSRRKFPMYPERENERIKSWIFRRARDREAQRVRGDGEFNEK